MRVLRSCREESAQTPEDRAFFRMHQRLSIPAISDNPAQ